MTPSWLSLLWEVSLRFLTIAMAVSRSVTAIEPQTSALWKWASVHRGETAAKACMARAVITKPAKNVHASGPEVATPLVSLSSARVFSWWPTSTIAVSAGMSCRPNVVRQYSTDGGEVGNTRRSSTPLSCSSRKRWDKTLAETGGMSMRSSLKRRGPSRKCQITLAAQAPEITAMHSVRLQRSGGGVLWFFRILRAMDRTVGYPGETQ